MKFLLLVIVCNLENVSGIQVQGKEDHNYTHLVQYSNLHSSYKSADKSNANLEETKDNAVIELNSHIKNKRETNIYNDTELGLQELPPPTFPPPTSPNIINFNKDILPKCPNRFTYYKDRLGNSVCYLITEPTPFPPPCPYPTTLEYFFISWHIQVTNQTHWAYTYRNVSDIGKKNCLVQNGTDATNLIPTSCTDKYPGVCVYTYDSNFRHGDVATPTFNHYCRKRYNASCVSNDFSSLPTCYCKSEASIKQQPRNTFCKKLVEIKNAYENNVLLQLLLFFNESCWIGLRTEAVKSSPTNETMVPYRWSSTNTSGQYTFWSNNIDVSKTYGALGKDGWSLDEDGALACAICEMEDEEHAQVHIHIKHNKSANLLEVEIQNPIEVFENVTCFAQNPDNYETIDLRYNREHFVATNLKFLFTTSGYYWCEALQIANLTLVYSNTIFIASSYGHEYALIVTSVEDAGETLYLPKSPSAIACNGINEQLHRLLNTSTPIQTITYNETEKTIEVLCHINMNPTQLSISEEFEHISELLKQSNAKITNLTSIEVCLPSVTSSGNSILQWPETLMGVTTIPEQLCLQDDGSPVTRTCTGNFYYGSHWLDVNGTCADVTYSERTRLLDDLLKSNTTTPSDLSVTLLNITEDINNFTSFEIHLLSKSLQKLVAFNESTIVTDTAMTVNNIMHFEPSQLKDSQDILNSTDMILYSLDEMLARTDVDDSGYTSAVTEKFVVQISNLQNTNIVGIKLEKTQKGFNPNKVNPLQQGASKEDLMKENLDLAMLIPQQLHYDIVNCVGPETSANLITTVFYDGVLFNEQQTTHSHSDGRVIGVTIPNFNCPVTAPLQIIFNVSHDENAQVKCASWSYGFNDLMESTHGQWLIEGDPKTVGDSTYKICEFTHVTHFTLLVLGDFNEITIEQKKALDVTTAVGSGFSVLGLVMVFFTAIMFKSFRSPSTVILLNFSIAITANIVLLFVADNLTENTVLCTVFGAALHYVVLSQFCWMLTIAVFQYNRYVVVFENTTTHLVAKSCVFAWGIPLIPVIIIMLISRDNYRKNSHGLCYALGNYFIFGVLVPVSVILFINLIVFVVIIISITSPRPNRVHQQNDNTFTLQLKLAILLFFLLGLTWGFGMLASINGGIIFSYLFCLTATLQGFVLFLYFIVLNEKTRTLWTESKICCCGFGKKDANRDPATKALILKPRNPQHSDIDTNLSTNGLLQRHKYSDNFDL